VSKSNQPGLGYSASVVFAAMAVCISWSQWKSVLWALLHGWCGVFYVIYYLFTRS
jgi:hypothetical protein